MNSGGYFITGTDTDAGKTVAAAAVLCALRAAGIDAVPMKPVQTGCAGTEKRKNGKTEERKNGKTEDRKRKTEGRKPKREDGACGLRSPDVDFCLRVAGLPEPDAAEYAAMVPCRYELPASPHLAARGGEPVEIGKIVAAFRALRSSHDAVVVEGAGGVLVPLNDGGETMLDLMLALALPVILVSKPGLGTINHTLLSLNELRRAGLEIAGVLFCDSTGKPWSEVERDNVATVERLGGVPVLGCVPFMEGLKNAECGTPDGEWKNGKTEEGIRNTLAGVLTEWMATQHATRDTEHETVAARLWAMDKASLWHPFTKHSAMAGEPFPIMVRGEGIYLYDVVGRRYLDAVSSWWAANLGHCHPRLVSAIRRQAGELQHSILGNLSHRPAAELASRLVRLFPDPRRRVFFAGDGACAVEASLRIAVQHWHNLGRGEKHRIASFHDGYHGDTLGAVSVGFSPGFHEPYKPLLFPAVQLPFPDSAENIAAAERLLEAHAGELAALIVEPHCQGAAGMRFYPPEHLKRLAACCGRLGILLIVDEVAMGFGRTGRMFSFEHAGIDPDIVCLGKGLSGGTLAMSAAVVKEEIFRSFGDKPVDHTFYHGHTFAGNPLAAAAALECLKIYEEDGIVARAAALGKVLAEAMRPLVALATVRNFRTLGMIAAFELAPAADGASPAERAQRIRKRLLAQGILIRPLGGTLYLLPPLVIPEAELRGVGAALCAAVAAEM
jgi:adenosylmethionine-8-amino-7-oxononanoate aminotransferase